MATNNYGSPLMPKIKVSLLGNRPEERSTIKFVGLDSSIFYMGGFVDIAAGSAAAPTGAEFGVIPHVTGKPIFGFVVGITPANANFPIWDYSNPAGTVTASVLSAGGTLLPVKYTFASTNDESNTTAMKGEMVEIMPLAPLDVLEIALFAEGSTHATVARGTTTAWGTTTSSANFGVGMITAVAEAPMCLLEASAAKNLAGLDFFTVDINGKKPSNPNHVYCMPLSNQSAYSVPIS